MSSVVLERYNIVFEFKGIVLEFTCIKTSKIAPLNRCKQNSILQILQLAAKTSSSNHKRSQEELEEQRVRQYHLCVAPEQRLLLFEIEQINKLETSSKWSAWVLVAI